MIHPEPIQMMVDPDVLDDKILSPVETMFGCLDTMVTIETDVIFTTLEMNEKDHQAVEVPLIRRRFPTRYLTASSMSINKLDGSRSNHHCVNSTSGCS